MECLQRAYDEGNIRKRTHKGYTERMEALMKKTNLGDIEVVLDHPKSMAAIQQQKADGSKLVIIKMIRAVFKYHPTLRSSRPDVYNAWDKSYKAALAPVALRTLWNVPSAAQLAAYMPWREVVERRDKLDIDSMAYFVLALYSMIPPVRNDLGDCRTLHEAPTTAEERQRGNYLLIRPGHMILTFNEFKSKSEIRPQYNKLLPMELADVIARSLLKQPRDFLIVSPVTGEPYTNDNSCREYVDRLIHGVTKPGLGMCMLRHVFIDSLDFNNLPGGALLAISQDMMHSRAQAWDYRLKFGVPVMRG